MKLILLVCLVTVLASGALAAPSTRKAADSSSESVESNESNSKETTVVTGNSGDVETPDTNTAQEVTGVDTPTVTETVTVRAETTKTVVPGPVATVPESTRNVQDVPEVTSPELKLDTVTTVLPETTNDDTGRVTLGEVEAKTQLPTERSESGGVTEREESNPTTQTANDPVTVEVTVTLAARNTDESVPVTTETEAVGETVATDV